MRQLVGHGVCTRTAVESGNALGTRITGNPEPSRFGGTAQLQAALVELYTGELQRLQPSLVQTLGVLAGAAARSGLSVVDWHVSSGGVGASQKNRGSVWNPSPKIPACMAPLSAAPPHGAQGSFAEMKLRKETPCFRL